MKDRSMYKLVEVAGKNKVNVWGNRVCKLMIQVLRVVLFVRQAIEIVNTFLLELIILHLFVVSYRKQLISFF